MKNAVTGPDLPKAVGPYSQAVSFGNLVFVSGQIGVDLKTGKLKEGIEVQVRQIFINLKKILSVAETEMNNVLKVNVYLKNISDYSSMNNIYEKQFDKPFPARATIVVAELPKGALVELDCIAYKNYASDDCGKSGCCGGCC